MRYRLRTLLIVLALGPPTLAAAWFYSEWMLFTFLVLAGYSTYLFFYITMVCALENTDIRE
jgi:hypothetical protein